MIGGFSQFLLTLLDPDKMCWRQDTLQNTLYKLYLHYNLTTSNNIKRGKIKNKLFCNRKCKRTAAYGDNYTRQRNVTCSLITLARNDKLGGVCLRRECWLTGHQWEVDSSVLFLCCTFDISPWDKWTAQLEGQSKSCAILSGQQAWDAWKQRADRPDSCFAPQPPFFSCRSQVEH